MARSVRRRSVGAPAGLDWETGARRSRAARSGRILRCALALRSVVTVCGRRSAHSLARFRLDVRGTARADCQARHICPQDRQRTVSTP